MIFYVNLFDIFQNAGSISIYIIRKIKSTLIVPNHFRKLSIKKKMVKYYHYHFSRLFNNNR